MTEKELRALAAKAQAVYLAMTPSQRLRHDYMQRRSFARGMCPSNRDYAEYCRHIDKSMPDEAGLTDAEIGLILIGRLTP